MNLFVRLFVSLLLSLAFVPSPPIPPSMSTG